MMKWEKEKSTQVARGNNGTFYITKRRGIYWGEYVSKTINFKFPPKRSIKDLKTLIQNNYYWED